jgi:hypothetical protein
MILQLNNRANFISPQHLRLALGRCTNRMPVETPTIRSEVFRGFPSVPPCLCSTLNLSTIIYIHILSNSSSVFILSDNAKSQELLTASLNIYHTYLPKCTVTLAALYKCLPKEQPTRVGRLAWTFGRE